MSKKELNVATELQSSQMSTEKTNELYGHLYAALAALYNAAQSNPAALALIATLDNNFGIVWQEFQASQSRVQIMGAAIQQKNATIEEITEEARKLAKLWNDHIASEAVPFYTNGHRKNGRH